MAPPNHAPVDLTGVQDGDLFRWDATPGELKRLTPAVHIADPAGGATVDAEARAAIVLILNALEAGHIVAP